MTTSTQSRPADTTTTSLPKPAFSSTESPTVIAVVMDFVGSTLPQLDHFLDSMRISSGGPGLPGSLFQWSRSTGDGVRVTEVWQSRRHFELFHRDVIAPRLSEAGLPRPEMTTYEVHGYLTQGPAVDLRGGEDSQANAEP